MGTEVDTIPLRDSMNYTTTACCETNWVDWFDQTIVEVLGQCENATSPPPPRKPVHTKDFAKAHDELLESLLHEQMTVPSDSDSQIINSSSINTSFSSEELPTKKSLFGKRKLEEIKRTGSNCSMTVNSTDLKKTDYPPAETFVHKNCRLQKDKGKGEPLGQAICAKGQAECLEKLRAKMKVLASVAFGKDKSTTAAMKRRKARITTSNGDYIETRSLIELKMGFLSMLYGVLARWDLKSEKVMMMVLRKNCSDSFYASSPPRQVRTRSQIENSIRFEQMSSGESPIFQRLRGVDISTLEPPYVVTRPAFEPTKLTVAVRRAICERHRSNYTAVIKFGKRKTTILLTWDKQREYMIPTLGESLTCTINNEASLHPSVIEVLLYEQKMMRRKSQRTLITSIDVPVSSLTPQSKRDARPVVVSVPFSKDDESCVIDLELQLVSEYLLWLDREIDARRRYGVGNVTIPEQESDSVWDWVLCVC